MDLNCDMGELKDGQDRNYDREIMPFITSCNIACGFHSGTPPIIEQTIRSAIVHGVKIGAHPSYNDRAHFGRRSVDYDLPTLITEWRYQICAIKGMVESLGSKLHHIKPHGALYNDMVEDATLATSFVELVKEIDPNLIIYGLAHSQVIEICEAHHISVINEGFADRRYDHQKRLRSRQLDGAVLHNPDEVIDQINNFVNGKVILYSGKEVPITVESICLHSDTEGAVVLSEKIHTFLKEKNIPLD